ncbi:MAG TPA: hypothetical protein PLB87_04920, partial [Prolixibacteraceae bacterium]|nr:hypothetical protein [Prolixibacteraceae bacterium]
MKTQIIFFIVFLFLSVSVFGQNNKVNKHHSDNVIKQKLDSLIVQNQSKKEYIYDTNGNITLEVDYYWDKGKWSLSFKTECIYDTNNNNTLRVRFIGRDNQWIPYDKFENNFNSNGQCKQAIFYNWNNFQWIPLNKYTHYYNANNKE